MTKRKTNSVKNWKPSLMVCKTLNLKAVLGNAEKLRNVSILNNLDSWNGTGKCLPCRCSIRQIEESKCFPLLLDGGFPAASSGLFCKSHQVLCYTACLERMNVGSADQVSTFTPNPSQGRIFISIETIIYILCQYVLIDDAAVWIHNHISLSKSIRCLVCALKKCLAMSRLRNLATKRRRHEYWRNKYSRVVTQSPPTPPLWCAASHE